MSESNTTRCGYVTIIGAPNAGKSTLLNALVGQKVAIVTPKVQTTRSRITGICTHERTQMIFLDTPGIFDAKARFEQAMVDAAWASVSEADRVLLILDAQKGLSAESEMIVEALPRCGKKLLLVLNKIDLAPKERLLALASELSARLELEHCFMISARKGDGVKDITEFLAARMPEGPWLFPEDQPTDYQERQIAAEITRESLFLRLGQELPYSLWVDTESWEERRDGSVRIQQIIYVQREGQKKIVIGEAGAMLRDIGQRARREISRVLGRKAHVFLFVKVQENWKETPDSYRAAGLEFKKPQ